MSVKVIHKVSMSGSTFTLRDLRELVETAKEFLDETPVRVNVTPADRFGSDQYTISVGC